MTEAYSQKETDIGLMPDDWDIVSIGSEFNIQQGKQVSARHRAGDNQKPFLRTANVFWNRIDLTVLDRMNFTAAEELRMKLHVNDVLVCEGGDVGRTALVSKELNGIYYQNHLHRLRVKNESINPLFFAYWMMYCWRFTEYYNGAGNKTTIPNLSQSRLKALLFPKPEKEEQNFIAEIISLIQSAIQKQEQIISTTTELKNALMKKLFTEGMNDEPLKKTEIGLIPESWEVVKIGSFGKCVTGTTPKTSVSEYYKNPQYDFIAPADIGETKFVYNSIKQISEAGINVVRHLPPNAVLCVCIGSTIGKVGLSVKEKSATNQQLNSIICNGDYDPQFIYYLLNYYSSYWRTFSTPSPVPILSKGTFEQIDIRATKNNEEQTSIVKTLSACDAKIEFHKNKKQTLKSLFSSSLHQLMTGKVRVNDAEKKVVQEAN